MALNSSALAVGSPGFQTLIQTDRQFVAAALGDRIGVLGAAELKVTSNPTSHAVDIAAGRAVLPGYNAQDQGSYFAWSEAAETLAWPAPSANPRIDTLVLRVADPQYGTVTGTQGARWDIVQGVPLATPAARSDTEINTTFFVPGAWIRMADIRVNAADSGVIPGGQVTDRRNNSDGWSNWTPASTGITFGNGTLTARYKKINSTLTAVSFYLVFGSTSAVTALSSITGLPFTISTVQSLSGFATDTSSSSRYPVVAQCSGTSLAVRIYTPAGGAGVNISDPFTWAVGDALQISGIVETTPW